MERYLDVVNRLVRAGVSILVAIFIAATTAPPGQHQPGRGGRRRDAARRTAEAGASWRSLCPSAARARA
jgi:Flp pilus assembly protein TadB